jgi:3-methyl-2-oxobutanoate hydroxymethyltransferase
MVTAYDYPGGLAADAAGIDMILVGDSLGMVVLGYESTVPVTMEEMLSHAAAVRRGTRASFVVGDMPFLSYQTGARDAILNAGRFLKEAGSDSVKLEGGLEMAGTVKAIVDAGIPVMGHIGLTPQSVSKLGGYRVQGKTARAALKLLDDALALEQAGAFSVVLESVPDRVSELVSQRLSIPTIGIGAGAGCDGQVLVFHDLLGYFDRFSPRHNKRYANIRETIVNALDEYRQEVESRAFPTAENSFTINDEEYESLLAALGGSSSLNGQSAAEDNAPVEAPYGGRS